MVVERIRQLLEDKDLTPTQFADLIGVGRPVMSHIMSERNKPSLEVVQRIIDAFPEISLPWLLKGTGDMLEAPAAPVFPSASEKEPGAVAASPLATPVLASSPTPAPTEAAPTAAIPVETPLITAGRAAAPAPQASGAPSLAAPAPAPLQPFRAPRFVPGPVAAPTPPPPAELPKPPSLPEAPAASVEKALRLPAARAPVASRPAGSTTSSTPPAASAAALAASLPPASTPIEAALPAFLAEPGKAIRRIVIFYRDGSFADYQPE